MTNSSKKNIYEKYHTGRKIEKRVIYDYDFTHNPLLKVLKNRLTNYSNALDIGCGTGTVCFYLASKGINVVGVDISKNAIKLAKINSKKLNLSYNTRFYVSDFPNTMVAGKFDLIICSEVLEHIEDESGTIMKIKDLLKKGGEVFLSVPLESSALYRKKFLVKFDEEVGHLRRYNDSKLLKLLKKAKLKVIDIRKNQGIIREYLFTSTTKSLIIAMANKFKFFSDFLTFIDERFYFLGVSNMTILAKKI